MKKSHESIVLYDFYAKTIMNQKINLEFKSMY